MGGPGTATYVQPYEEGSLIIDMADPKSKKVIWRGSFRTKVKGNTDRALIRQAINEAVWAILRDFPPTRSKEQ